MTIGMDASFGEQHEYGLDLLMGARSSGATHDCTTSVSFRFFVKIAVQSLNSSGDRSVGAEIARTEEIAAVQDDAPILRYGKFGAGTHDDNLGTRCCWRRFMRPSGEKMRWTSVE